MSVYSKNSLAVREGRGELEFSESERIYGPSRHGMTRHSRPLSADSGSRVRYRQTRPGYYSNGFRSNANPQGARIVSTGRRPGSATVTGYGGTQGSRGGGGRSRLYNNNITQTNNYMVNREHQGHPQYTTVSRGNREREFVQPENYYVRETIPEDDERSVSDKEVETCCCGCVQIVESKSCGGMNTLRCCVCVGVDTDDDDKENLVKKEPVKSQTVTKTTTQNSTKDGNNTYLMYRSNKSTNYISDKDSDTDYDTSDTDNTYAEIGTGVRTQDQRVKTNTLTYQSKREFDNYAGLPPPHPPVPAARANTQTTSNKTTIIPGVTKRHVGVQMETKYVVEPPKRKKKLVRDIGVQTIKFEKKHKPRRARTPPPRVPSPRRPSPPPRRSPSPPPPVVEKKKYYGERPPIEKYKTAIIHLEDNTVQEDKVIVIPAKAPEVIEAPKRIPTPEPTPIYYIEPDMTIEPLYEPLPLPIPEPKV